LTVRFRNTGGGPLGTLTTGLVTSPNLTWVQEELEGPVPVGTRNTDVELLGDREETTWINAFFDDTSLQIAVVPEPLTMLGMFLGLGSVGAYIRRRRMR